MPATYDTDLNSWAIEQAALLRAGRVDLIDAVNLADEIADLAKQVQRELAGELGKLLGHLLLLRGAGHSEANEAAIRAARAAVALLLRESPSLRQLLEQPAPDWLDVVWSGAVAQALQVEPALAPLPEACPYRLIDVLADDAGP